MLDGELYDPLDQQLSEERMKARLLIKALNETGEDEVIKRTGILKELIPRAGEGLWLQPPFYCDYGSNMILGCNLGENRQPYTFRTQCTDLYRHPSHRLQGTRLRTGVCQAYRNRGGCLGGRQRGDLPRGKHRGQNGHRSRQCSYQTHSGRGICGGKSLPGYPNPLTYNLPGLYR